MEKIFKVGSFCFKLVYPQDLSIPDNLIKFESDNDMVEYTYEINISDSFPPKAGKQLAKRADLDVYGLDQLETRYIGVKGMPEYYACYQEIDEKNAKIYIHPERMAKLNIDPVFISLLALERRLIQKDSLILHCAYIDHQQKAILFSAPSETGKTTQANLWEKYQNSATINGDRGLLTKIEDGWMIQGFPVCGTSDVCFNESREIKAIVMLSQAKENTVTRLKPAQAFIELFSQITKNQWNIQDNKRTIDLVDDLITKVPIYHLACNISKDAVDCLANILYQD